MDVHVYFIYTVPYHALKMYLLFQAFDWEGSLGIRLDPTSRPKNIWNRIWD